MSELHVLYMFLLDTFTDLAILWVNNILFFLKGFLTGIFCHFYSITFLPVSVTSEITFLSTSSQSLTASPFPLVNSHFRIKKSTP